jgi:ATP synthase protein I
VTFVLKGPHAALSALYGGGVALANALLLARRVERASELARDGAQRGVYSLYFGAVQRFVFVLVSLGIGLGLLRLDPLPLLALFAIAQLAYLIAAGKQVV